MARITTRQGLMGKSFGLAAEAVSDAVGCSISRESVRQVTQGWGGLVEEARQELVEAVFDPLRAEPAMPVPVKPIVKQATLSSTARRK